MVLHCYRYCVQRAAFFVNSEVSVGLRGTVRLWFGCWRAVNIRVSVAFLLVGPRVSLSGLTAVPVVAAMPLGTVCPWLFVGGAESVPVGVADCSPFGRSSASWDCVSLVFCW